MEDEVLVSSRQPALRFRQPLAWLRLCTGCAALGLGLFDGFAGHSPNSILAALVFGALGATYVVGFFAVSWTLSPDGILERQYTSSRFVPYSDVTVVGPATSGKHGIEVRYASLPGTFPENTIKMNVADREKFLNELRRLAPAAEFRV